MADKVNRRFASRQAIGSLAARARPPKPCGFAAHPRRHPGTDKSVSRLYSSIANRSVIPAT
jgi:hypothetical protein